MGRWLYSIYTIIHILPDVLRPEKGIAGTPDEMTDGKYIWPGDLAYYVLNYDLQLNKEFIDYMIEHEWTVPNGLHSGMPL